MPDYIIDAASSIEAVRLIDLEHVFTEAMGGLFPETLDTSKIAAVLNLGCGPGEWDISVAFNYPHMIVTGVDLSEEMVKYAHALAEVRQLENVTFEIMDIKQPLDFPDSSFDLINGRLLFGFMDRESWPQLIAECRRVLRPGGIITLAEREISISNSLALQHLQQCLYRVLADQERTYSVDRRSVGICHMLGSLLQQAGFIAIEGQPFYIDSSYQTHHHHADCKNIELEFNLLKPYLLKTLEASEYESLYTRMQMDFLSEQFVNISFGLQVWGYNEADTDFL